MKRMKVTLTVSGLMACLLFSGCDTLSKATKLSVVKNQTVMVVPVQGVPVTVLSQHASVSILGGMVGAAVERAATGGARKELAQRLNRDASDFAPEVILAEECTQLLRNSPIPVFRSAILPEESVLLPEDKKLLMNETKPFKAGQSNLTEWFSLFNKWYKGPPVLVGSDQRTGDPALLCLEIRFRWVEINHGDKLYAAPLVRLVDRASEKVIGAQYVEHGAYDIRPVTADSDPAAFREDFRKIANQLAKEALTKMKLL